MATARDRYSVTPSLTDIKAATLANHAVFRRRLAELQREHAGQFVLMRDGNVVDFFETDAEALRCGRESYDDRLYSIHRVMAPGEPPITIRSPVSH
jgi:hypothetical protein